MCKRSKDRCTAWPLARPWRRQRRTTRRCGRLDSQHLLFEGGEAGTRQLCRRLQLAPAVAARQELLAAEAAAAAGPSYAQVDVDDLLDDPDLEKLHAERLAQMQREAEKRVKMQQKGHGAQAALSNPSALFLAAVPCAHCAVAPTFTTCCQPLKLYCMGDRMCGLVCRRVRRDFGG